MGIVLDVDQDIMQVCRNGHVITDRLRGDPSSGRFHCNRCGASTFQNCLTCGHPLLGAKIVPGLIPVGTWPAPQSCAMCGATFPWVRKPTPAHTALAVLERLLRRLPLVIRQLRWRQGEQTPFRVKDERDLEDVLRSVLPIHFDDIRPERRTPVYSATNQTDFLLAPERIAVTAIFARPNFNEKRWLDRRQHDVAYYRKRRSCRKLVSFIYDPSHIILEPHNWECAWSEEFGDLDTRCIVSTA